MRVAIVHDVDGWAQNLHSEGLRKNAPRGFSVTTHRLAEFAPSGEDAVYVINFASAARYGKSYSATCVASHAWMHLENDPADWRTRGVNRNRNSMLGRSQLNRADAVVCRNQALAAWASQYHSNARCIPAGVDTDIFHTAGRKARAGRLRVGWSGQINPEREGHFKGFYECWEPLRERLRGRYEFVENTRTAAEAMGWEAMAGWYRSLDVFLTTATAEGTPNGPFVAAACGAVVISTRVGQVADWEALDALDLIVPDYGNESEATLVQDAIAKRLKTLEDRSVLSARRCSLLDSIEREYSYCVLAPKTLEFVCGVKS